MKPLSLLLCVLLLVSCQEEETKKPLNTLEKVAYAHGFEHWDKVEEIKFTFNIDRDTEHFERSWEWRPKKNEVSLIKKGKRLDFNRDRILSDQELAADKNFANDINWLLAPYSLVWDTHKTHEEPVIEVAPISKDTLQKLTVVYDSIAEYAAGDAYDFYIDQNNMVKEWVYREDNSTSHCMATTWENFKDLEGLKIATMHQNENGVFRLYFTGIKITVSK